MLLASCGADIKFHEWPTGDYYGSFQLPEVCAHKPSISWCNEGELLATSNFASDFPSIIYVGQILQTYMIIDVPQVQSLSFPHMTRSEIMLGTTHGNILLYDIHRQEVTKKLPRVPAAVTHLEYGVKDSSLAVGCENHQIYLYNTNYSICSMFYMPNNNNLTAMAYHNTQPNLLAAAGSEGTVVVWDSNNGSTTVVDKAHSDIITDLAFSYGEEMITVGLDHKFKGYDLRSKSNTFSGIAESKLSAVKILPTGAQLAVASVDGKLLCYDKRNIKQPFNTIVTHCPTPISCLAFQCAAIKDDGANNLSQTASKVTTVVCNPHSPRVHKSVTQHGGSINYIQNPQCSQANYDTSASGDWKVKNGGTSQQAIFVPFGLTKTHIAGSCMNFQPPALISTDQKHTQAPKPNECTNLLKKFACATKEVNSKFENNIQIMQTKTIENWFEKIPNCPSDCNLNNSDISQAMKELSDFTKDSFAGLNEFITKEFVEIRLSISKEFMKLENKINARWEELDSTFMKLSKYALMEDFDVTNIQCQNETNKAEKDDEDSAEQKSRIPVLNFSIK